MGVLILVVVEDGLVHGIVVNNVNGVINVLILVVVEDGLVQPSVRRESITILKS